MELEHIAQLHEITCNAIITKITETRPQEIVIISLLTISIGLGIAILIQLKKLKDKP